MVKQTENNRETWIQQVIQTRQQNMLSSASKTCFFCSDAPISRPVLFVSTVRVRDPYPYPLREALLNFYCEERLMLSSPKTIRDWPQITSRNHY